MMKNCIDARVEFYFKGELFAPSATLKLDQYMQTNGKLPEMYLLLANENNIDSYSYHYEVMQQENIIFSNPVGMVEKFLENDNLDIEGFQNAWIEREELKLLQSIAGDILDIADLEQQPEIKKALLQAFHAGKQKA